MLLLADAATPHTATDGHAWIHALPGTPQPWRPQILNQPTPPGHAPGAVVAVCRAPQGRPLFAASVYWHCGTVEITNHHTRADLRARLILVKKLAAQA